MEPLVRGETFIIYNGDILCDLPLEPRRRRISRGETKSRSCCDPPGGPLHISLDGQAAACSTSPIGSRVHAAALSFHRHLHRQPGVSFRRIPSRTKISVIPIFLNMIQKASTLGGVVIDEGHWWDLGTREKVSGRAPVLRAAGFRVRLRARRAGWPQWKHPGAQVAAGARVAGATAIGAGASVGERAQVTDCMLWEKACESRPAAF